MSLEIDHAAIARFVQGPEVKDAITDLGEDAKDRAKSYAPVLSGELRESIDAEVVDGPSGPTAIITASAGHALSVEYGTVDTPAQPFLVPAVYEAVKRI